MNGRVCLVRQAIYPLDLMTRREAETLHQAGLETHVICLDKLEREPVPQQPEIINGVHVHRIPVKRKKTSVARYMFDYLSFAFLASLRLTALHFKHRFDVIQVDTMPDFLVFATAIPKLFGAKTVAMMNEPTPELWEALRQSRPPRLLALVEQMALAYVDKSFTVTQQMKDTYVSRGADAGKIGVILNAPEPTFLAVGDDTAGEPDPGFFTLICHGAIEDRYGQDTILDATALVRSQIPNLRVKILGKGTYVDGFLAQRKALGLEDCVDYLGYVPLAQMVREICAADAGIVAQKSSSYSNLVHTCKMYEYISFGKPVLASRLSATAAYFGDDALRYFEAGNPQSLAEGILDLYRHPETREALVRKAQERYMEYRWERQKEIFLAAYQHWLA